MRIGIFTECYKPVMNGVSVSIETFKNGLLARDHEVFIFAPDNDEAKAEHHVYRFPSIEDKKGRLYPIMFPSITLEQSYLPSEIIESLDVIHAQHMFTAGRLARFAANKFDKPLIYTYHTLLAEYTHYFGFLSPLAKSYLRNMSKRFCDSCDQIITPSNSMKKVLQSYRINAPIEVIMTGIEPKNYERVSEQEDKQLRQKYKIHPKTKICLYISRIAKEKNLDLLFKSFKRIIKTLPECHLLMVGGGPEEEWAKKRLQYHGIQNKVTMTGMVPKEEANKLFGFGDVFTFPSYTETQGIVVAEAMAAGTPPVAVSRMGPTDLIKNGRDGYLTKLEVADFTEKVLKLLQDEKLHDKMAKAGIERVEEFSNQTSVTKLVLLYEKVLHRFNSKARDTR